MHFSGRMVVIEVEVLGSERRFKNVTHGATGTGSESFCRTLSFKSGCLKLENFFVFALELELLIADHTLQSFNFRSETVDYLGIYYLLLLNYYAGLIPSVKLSVD